MTPPAITPAGRVAAKSKAAGTGTGRPAGAAGTRPGGEAQTGVPGHRRGVRQQPAPRAPRRVSGPAEGRAAGAVAPQPQRTVPQPQRTVPQPQRTTLQPRQRTIQQQRPAIRAQPRRARRRAASRSAGAPLAARAIGFVRALPDHVLLDRIVRGRAWIPLLGVMLAGIVAMQVEVLKLGASMGRSIQLSAALQTRNESLRSTVAGLADDQRIKQLAAGMGMVMPAPDGVGFLPAPSRGNVQQAVGSIHAPDAPAFLALTTTNGAIAGSTSTGTASSTSATVSTPATAATPATAPTAATPATAPTAATPATAQAAGQATAPTTPGQGAGSSQGTSPAQTATAAGTTSPASGSGAAQAGGAAGATAPVQVAPTQSSSSQTGAPASGGAAVPTGG